MTRRFWFSLWLALLLGLVQQLSVTHTFEHTADWLKPTSVQPEKSGTTQVCPICLALSGIQSAVASSSLPPVVTKPVQVWFELTWANHFPSFSFHYQSRAPPPLHIF